MAQEKMTVEKWLSNVVYDDSSSSAPLIFNKQDDGVTQAVAHIRGIGRLQHEFKTLSVYVDSCMGKLEKLDFMYYYRVYFFVFLVVCSYYHY